MQPIILLQTCNKKGNVWTRKDLQIENEFLSNVFKTGYIKKGIKFKDVTNPLEGRHLYDCIVENKYTKTLEIGFAMGASTAYMCQAHKKLDIDGTHIAIDPNQDTQYKGLGRFLIRQCGLSKQLETVMEMPSHRALPKLYNEILNGTRQKFQLVYIDGWHTFDYTLVDFFYANLILVVNGMIVLDDIRHRSVKCFLDFVKKNYSHYKVVSPTPCYDELNMKESTQATFIKLS